jgi:hypothetical protein
MICVTRLFFTLCIRLIDLLSKSFLTRIDETVRTWWNQKILKVFYFLANYKKAQTHRVVVQDSYHWI